LNARRASALLLAILALVATALVGCGGDDDGGGEVDVGPAAAAPANAPIYLDGTVRPQGSAKTDAEGAVGKVLDSDDPGDRLISLIDEAAQQEPPEERFTYEADIEPWLGDRIGAFFIGFEGDGTGAAVVETTNPDQALDFAQTTESGATETAEHGGTTYYRNPADGDSFAIVGDFLVFGDEAGVTASIDAEAGDSLGESGEFTDALGDLPEDRLGTFYTVPENLLAAIPQEQLDPSARSFFERAAGENLDAPVSGALTATPESFDLEFIAEGEEVETPESALIGEVPADAWLALGIGDLGSTVRRTLDQLRNANIPGLEQGISQLEGASGASLDELTDALGDAVFYVQGVTEPTLTGALVIQVKDAELTGRLLSQLQGLLTLGGVAGVKALSLPAGGSGFQINDPSNFPQPVELAQQGDKFVIGYGNGSAQQALQPADPLSDSPTFGAAKDQVAALGADLFLSFPQIFQLAEAEGAKQDPGYLEAKPYIDALEYLISGSGTDDGKVEAKAVLGLK
jgi:Protein of unknown function (DUF3352)